MAVSEPRVFHPKRAANFDTAAIRFEYDRTSDTLMAYHEGKEFLRAAVSVPASDFEYFRVDAHTEEIVGFQIEDFLLHAVHVNPLYLALAEMAGFDADELAAVRAAVEERQRRMDPQERGSALLNLMFGGFPLGQGVA